MPIKVLKSEKAGESSIERIIYTKRYRLTVDRARCVGCEICKIVCPKEAITITNPARTEGQKKARPQISIDENKCHFCGICEAICPFGALTLRIDGKEAAPVIEKNSFPQIVHEIEVEEFKCPTECKKCEEKCPLGIIKVSPTKPIGRVKVTIDAEHCPCCRLCEVECPEAAIHVRKSIIGSIKINAEKCPEGCRDCADVCPITGVLSVGKDGKVHVNDYCCVYCGACKVACPVEGALELKRTSIHHTPVRSGAWNKALEKLTSTGDVAKELRGRLILRSRESVRRLFTRREEAQVE